MSKHYGLDEKLFYPLVRGRERDSRDLLPDILRDMNFRPRHVVVEQKTLSVWGVSFSRTRVFIAECECRRSL